MQIDSVSEISDVQSHRPGLSQEAGFAVVVRLREASLRMGNNKNQPLPA